MEGKVARDADRRSHREQVDEADAAIVGGDPSERRKEQVSILVMIILARYKYGGDPVMWRALGEARGGEAREGRGEEGGE